MHISLRGTALKEFLYKWPPQVRSIQIHRGENELIDFTSPPHLHPQPQSLFVITIIKNSSKSSLHLYDGLESTN